MCYYYWRASQGFEAAVSSPWGCESAARGEEELSGRNLGVGKPFGVTSPGKVMSVTESVGGGRERKGPALGLRQW